MEPLLDPALEDHRNRTFRNARQLGLEPVQIKYKSEKLSDGRQLHTRPVEIEVRDPKTDSLEVRPLCGPNSDQIWIPRKGTGPIGPICMTVPVSMIPTKE